MASYTPRFDVLPHGVAKEGTTVYAVFKMILCMDELVKPPTNSLLSNGDPAFKQAWTAFLAKANQFRWKLDTSAAGKLVFSTSNDADSNIQFRIRNAQGQVRTQKDPAFGSYLSGSTLTDAWKVLDQGVFTLEALASEQQTSRGAKQFKLPDGLHMMVNANKRVDRYVPDPFIDVLRGSRDYAQTGFSRLQQAYADSHSTRPVYQFRAILANVMDHPPVAEYRFGMIREFRVPIQQLLPAGDGVLEYAIQVDQDASGTDFKIVGKGGRYSNGLRAPFLSKTDVASVWPAYFDPYKAYLENNMKHPDGCYCLVTYHENGTDHAIVDPFDKAYLKGFNVVVRHGINHQLYCLSRYKKTITLAGSGQTIQDTAPGLQTAQADMVTTTGNVRNVVLFCWRGDNLSVNRTVSPEDTHPDEQTGHATTDGEFCAEDTLVNEKMFTTNIELVKISNIQLVFSNPYSFIVRHMTPTEYCLPLASELDTVTRAYTLTVEDEQPADTDVLAVAPLSEDVSYFPMKAPMFVGTRPYLAGDLENAAHVVLKRPAETLETRFVYPPQIKIEDLRMMGYMANARIRPAGVASIPQATFVNNCLRLEKKFKQSPPKFVAGQQSVTYLADPRVRSLYICPADLFTLSQLKPLLVKGYAITPNFPFYDALLPVAMRVSAAGTASDISFNGSTQRYAGVKDGIYRFQVYAVDGKFQPGQALDTLPAYSSAPMRVSIVNSLPKPEKDTANIKSAEAIRGKDGSKTYWYYELPLKKAYHTWRSLKYQEETEVLRLQHQQVPRLLQDYYLANPSAVRFELMTNEYPYDIFIAKEGSITARKDLRTTLYHTLVKIIWQASDAVQSVNGLFFKLRLTEVDTLEVDTIPGATRVRLGAVSKKLSVHVELDLVFDTVKHQFVVMEGGNVLFGLTGTVSPELSVQDIEVADEMLRLLQRDPGSQVKMNRSTAFTFISDLETTYYRKKKIKLFASSIFQGYYPTETSEIKLGTDGDTHVIDIPNNEPPETPAPDPETLLMYTLDDKWRDAGSRNYKEKKTEHLVRLSLQQDFMKEGPNMLGIVLTKKTAGPSKTDDDVSEIGEDITKKTREDWKESGLDDLIHFSPDLPPVIQKYLNGRNTRFYKIGDTVYEVLVLQPFYNIDTKKWQVVLPFNLLGASETLFIKFVTLKICHGHGLTLPHADAPNSLDNPYVDTSGTNLSPMSKPVHFPIYNLKLVTLDRKPDRYRIALTRHSEYNNKVYFIMLMARRIPGSVMAATDAHAFPDLVSFSSNGVETAGNTGKILMFRDDVVPEISRPVAQSLLVLEFEQHANLHYQPLTSVQTGGETLFDDKKVQFVNFNPLFESKGLRLINAAEFLL